LVGTWGGVDPNCAQVTCTASFSHKKSANCEAVTTCAPECATGYTISSSSALTCNNGNFGTQPTCTASACTALPSSPAWATPSCTSGVNDGSVCTIACTAGYQGSSTTRTCQLGVWNGAHPSCTPPALPPSTVEIEVTINEPCTDFNSTALGTQFVTVAEGAIGNSDLTLIAVNCTGGKSVVVVTCNGAAPVKTCDDVKAKSAASSPITSAFAVTSVRETGNNVPKGGGGSNNTPIIIGVIVAVVGFLLLAGLGYYCYKKRNEAGGSSRPAKKLEGEGVAMQTMGSPTDTEGV